MAARLDDHFDRHGGALGPAASTARHDIVPLRARLDRLIDGDVHLPLPGHGHTLARWQALARVAREDLALVKLYESHFDAVAILRELDPAVTVPRGTVHAVWASEARHDPIRLRATTGREGGFVVDGRKSWCSGASVVDRALMTAVDGDGQRRIVEVDLSSAGITIDTDRWHAVGMRATGSFDVVCAAVPVRVIGPVDGYLARPGFWHGGAGIAACWHGAAAAIGTRVRDLQAGRDDVHALAHLGAIDAALAASAALLRETADAIDRSPRQDAGRIVLRVRGAVADLCELVIHHAGRAIGPGPFCHEGDLAQRVADLPIFMRQSRAEHDRVAQARLLLADADELGRDGWTL